MLTMFSLCELLRGREGHKLEREIQKIQRGPRSYFWSIKFFCADSSLLSLEAMFSFSPAWHVVKDRLHYALNSLESCTSTKELWRIAKWLCPAGSRLHIDSNGSGSCKDFQQEITANFPDRWAADEWAQWDKLIKSPFWNTRGIVSRLFGIVFVHMKVGF